MADPKTAEAITEFSTPSPSSNPAKPDFVTDGMILNLPAAVAATPVNSKSVRVAARSETSTLKNVYVQSDKAGAFDVEIMLDESERVAGAAVWRKHSTANAVAANVLSKIAIADLFRQIRIVYTPTTGPAIVKAWVFSIP